MLCCGIIINRRTLITFLLNVLFLLKKTLQVRAPFKPLGWDHVLIFKWFFFFTVDLFKIRTGMTVDKESGRTRIHKLVIANFSGGFCVFFKPCVCQCKKMDFIGTFRKTGH